MVEELWARGGAVGVFAQAVGEGNHVKGKEIVMGADDGSKVVQQGDVGVVDGASGSVSDGVVEFGGVGDEGRVGHVKERVDEPRGVQADTFEGEVMVAA